MAFTPTVAIYNPAAYKSKLSLPVQEQISLHIKDMLFDTALLVVMRNACSTKLMTLQVSKIDRIGLAARHLKVEKIADLKECRKSIPALNCVTQN